MSFSLTIPELLRQIQAEHVDADIYRRCQEAERLCRQGEFDSSLEHVRATVESATQSGVPLNIGAAFLYLAAICHEIPRKNSHDQAPHDAETAVNWLKRDAHHVLIAHLICARIYLEDQQWRPTLRHYRAAQTQAEQLALYWHRRNKPGQENYYKDIRDTLSAAVRKIQPPAAPTAEPSASSTRPSHQHEAHHTEPPVGKTDAPAGDAPTIQLTQPSPLDKITLDSYEISRVWINGQEYLVETVNPVDPQQPGLRLQPDQKYHAVLVNETGQPTEGQLITAGEPVQLRVWTETADEIDEQEEAKFVGALEAHLRLAPPTQMGSETQPKDKQVGELLKCVDALTAVIDAGRKPNRKLVAVRHKLWKYLQHQYNLHVIPIKPRKTKFDPALGHVESKHTQNARLPEGVIVHVKRHGYTRDGEVVRKAYVIVNRK